MATEILPFSVNGDRRAPSTDEIALVEIGCSVWALDLEVDTDADTNAIKGGTVFSIETDVDLETGEVQRRFITATPWQGRVRFDVVKADEVRQLGPPNAAACRTLIDRAARVVSRSKKRMSTDVGRCITLQSKLMEVL